MARSVYLRLVFADFNLNIRVGGMDIYKSKIEKSRKIKRSDAGD